jgi:signal transduction histidine kinase
MKEADMATAVLAQPAHKVRAAPREFARRLLDGVLRIPLVLKIMGANGIIVVVAVALVGRGLWSDAQGELTVVLVALAIASIVNLALVGLALSPIAELERVAWRVSNGEFTARVTPSSIADPQLAHLTVTINGLLDSLAAERKRIQRLGAEVVSAQDTERARLSRDLHESIAQTLAGVRFQLLAAGATATTDEMRNNLASARALIGRAMEEARNISLSLHPRITDDLGLVSALESLADQTTGRGIVDVTLKANIGDTPVPATVAATLFRVAQEALKTTEMRPGVKSATINLTANNGVIRLEVTDGVRKLDRRPANADTSAEGLTSIRDRVALSGGTLRIASETNGGTKVTAELLISDEGK